MPGIFRHLSAPWEDLFDADVIGDGPQAHNFTEGGVPMRFAHIQYGTKRPDIGFTVRIGGADVDVTTLWAQKGSAAYLQAPVLGGRIDVLASGISTATATLTLTLLRNGECDVTRASSPGGTARTDSAWVAVLNPTIGDQYEVMLTPVFSSGSATVTNGAPSYVAINADRLVRLSRTITTQSVVVIEGHINIKIRLISTGQLMLDFNQPFRMEVGNVG